MPRNPTAPTLEDIFKLPEDYLRGPQSHALRPALIEGVERKSGQDRLLKYWPKANQSGRPLFRLRRSLLRQDLAQTPRALSAIHESDLADPLARGASWNLLLACELRLPNRRPIMAIASYEVVGSGGVWRVKHDGEPVGSYQTKESAFEAAVAAASLAIREGYEVQLSVPGTRIES